MFGPESGKYGWNGLIFVYEKVKINDHHRCARFLALFEEEGCRMQPMTCEEHDIHAAGSQFITHTTGRLLDRLGVSSTPINTKGFEILLKLVENTCKDSMDLYRALYIHNPNAPQQLQNLHNALTDLTKTLQSQQ
eukprot:NODE_9438_length_592_cov_24.982942_g8803_i0.p1 GENE.NODE_9438_length_592_cov_24.982942_g8803_i0~~NODE_9438_length_592_cov_24.982942_g8803_i0.p1  ORF type:complete len:148 (-),score=43.75 NODE_9438_length_592_cov_24.982942_g8803_i0:149-553(-)